MRQLFVARTRLVEGSSLPNVEHFLRVFVLLTSAFNEIAETGQKRQKERQTLMHT